MERFRATRLGRVLDAFLRPVLPGQRESAQRVWNALPPEVQGPDQALGRASSGCAATYGVLERCNFACTACYLAPDANATPPLPLPEVFAQLEAIREHLGPWGNVQITAGEVTLLPVERLLKVLRHCRSLELSPMLMTNGSVILDDPGYLERLVAEGDLSKVAIHVDTTQRGRRGWRSGQRERELEGLRERFAELVRATRRRTGRTLHAAHTVTVTRETLEDVPDVVRWTLEGSDAFRMLSFQPVAGVGRTEAESATNMRAELWERICEGLGVRANPDAWHFGHRDCSNIVLAFVVGSGAERHVVEVTRADRRIDRWFLRRLLDGGLAGFCFDGDPLSISLARLAGRLARRPYMLLDAALFCAYRAWSDRRLLWRVLLGLGRGRRPSVRPFVLVVHHFMNADELDTEEGQLRLAACAFRVPVDGELVSMCELNGRHRADLNRADRERLGGRTPRELERAHP
jgi:hypothetical protein